MAKTHLRSIIDSCSDPTQREVFRAAKAYVGAGLSLIPISTDRSKKPAFELLPRVWCEGKQKYSPKWGVFRERRPELAELESWYHDPSRVDEYGMAILAGQISGNLEILDFDTYDLVKPFRQELHKRSPGLFKRLVRVKTPRPGLHCYYRCEEIGGNIKLASIKDPESPDDKPKAKAVIETRGEGGYCLAPPSPPNCHPRQKCYEFLGDLDLTAVPTITCEERAALFDAARTFDEWGKRHASRPFRSLRPSGVRLGDRPGDDFNARAEWSDILEPHGWRVVSEDGNGACHWCRPGKECGVSATTNYEGRDILYVFSSNADPFEPDTGYSKFHAYTLLIHEGEFDDAASALRRMGYGPPIPQHSRARRKKPSTSPYRGLGRIHSRNA